MGNWDQMKLTRSNHFYNLTHDYNYLIVQLTPHPLSLLPDTQLYVSVDASTKESLKKIDILPVLSSGIFWLFGHQQLPLTAMHVLRAEIRDIGYWWVHGLSQTGTGFKGDHSVWSDACM